jgi:hypothetical protein
VVPTIVFHGDCDLTVNAVNADHVLSPWVQAPEERDTTHRPNQRVRVARRQVPGGYAYTRSIYHDLQGRALMEKWIVHQMGHAWSGGSPSGSYSDPKGPNASAEMVRFFSAHPHGWDQRPLGRSSGVPLQQRRAAPADELDTQSRRQGAAQPGARRTPRRAGAPRPGH